MNELKTLKDLHTKAGIYEDNDVDDFKIILKAEAVKWVKDMQDKKHYLCSDYFKHFFNLTEKDLEVQNGD